MYAKICPDNRTESCKGDRTICYVPMGDRLSSAGVNSLCFFRRAYKRDRDRPDIRQASLMFPLVSSVKS